MLVTPLQAEMHLLATDANCLDAIAPGQYKWLALCFPLGTDAKAERPARVRSHKSTMSKETCKTAMRPDVHNNRTIVPHPAERRKKRLMMIFGDHMFVAALDNAQIEVHQLLHGMCTLPSVCSCPAICSQAGTLTISAFALTICPSCNFRTAHA